MFWACKAAIKYIACFLAPIFFNEFEASNKKNGRKVSDVRLWMERNSCVDSAMEESQPIYTGAGVS
jgi:hypothetical protein